MKLQNFDWRSMQRYWSPQAAGDLNVFIEQLPQKAGHASLVIAGVAWAIGAGLGLYATIQAQQLTTLRAELKETKALQPIVPKIRDVPVAQTEVTSFANDLMKLYPDLVIKQQGAAIYITSASTANFGQFREAVGHVQNGGVGWRVTVDRLCVGRECSKDSLAALLKINTVSVDMPKNKK